MANWAQIRIISSLDSILTLTKSLCHQNVKCFFIFHTYYGSSSYHCCCFGETVWGACSLCLLCRHWSGKKMDGSSRPHHRARTTKSAWLQTCSPLSHLIDVECPKLIPPVSRRKSELAKILLPSLRQVAGTDSSWICPVSFGSSHHWSQWEAWKAQWK